MSSATSLPFGVNDTAVRTTLSSGITSTDTSVDVGEVTNPPALPFLIAVFVDQSPLREDEMEIMEVTSISGTTLTVTRGAKGTAAQSFSSGDKVFVGIVPSDAFDQVGVSRSEIQSAAGTREIQQSLNELAFSIAESQFNQNLTRLDYDGGLFHVFEDTRGVEDSTSGLLFNKSVGPFAEDLQTSPTELTDAEFGVFEVSFAPNGRLAAGSTDNNTYIYDSNLNLTNTLTDSGGFVRAVAFGPNGRIAVGSGDNNTYIYDSNLNLTNTLSDAESAVSGVTFGSNGRIAVGSFDNNTYIYNSNLNLTDTLIDAGDRVRAVAFGPNGRIAVGSTDNNTYIYDSNLNLTNTLADSGDAVYAVAFAPNGRLAAGSTDNNTYIYDSNLNLTNTLTDSGGFVRAVAFGPNGRIAVGSGDNKTYIYDSNLNLTNTLADAGDRVRAVAFGPNGRIAVGSTDNNTYIYDSNLNLTNTLADSGDTVHAVAFGPNGRLAAGSVDNNTYVYDINKTNPIFVSFSEIDLSDDGFTSPPADAVVAHDFTPDADGSHTINYTVSDQTGNSVTITESEVGGIVDVSSLQDTTLSIQVDVADDDLNASLNDFAIHFNE